MTIRRPLFEHTPVLDNNDDDDDDDDAVGAWTEGCKVSFCSILASAVAEYTMNKGIWSKYEI